VISDGITFIPSFVKIGELVQKFNGEMAQTDTYMPA